MPMPFSRPPAPTQPVQSKVEEVEASVPTLVQSNAATVFSAVSKLQDKLDKVLETAKEIKKVLGE